MRSSIGSSCSFSIRAKNPLLSTVVKLREYKPQLLGDCAVPSALSLIFGSSIASVHSGEKVKSELHEDNIKVCTLSYPTAGEV